MKRYGAASALAILLVCAVAQAAFSSQTGAKRLNLSLKEVPFPEVISQIFSGSPSSYSVDPALGKMKVSATLKNVTLEQAIRVITKTAGVVYVVDTSNTYIFKPDPQVVRSQEPAQGPRPAAPTGPTTTDLATLRFISAGDAASMLSASPPDGLMSIVATSVNTLLLKGSAEAIDQARKLIRLFDVEAALPRSVRVTISLRISGAGPGNPIDVTTQSVGTEGSPIPLSINSVSGQTDSYMLDATLNPTVLVDGSVSLTGSGGIDCTLVRPQGVVRRLSKSFEVAASATSGAPTVIASGSAGGETDKAEFTVSVTVTVEKGRIVVPRGSLSPSRTGSAPPARTPQNAPQRAALAKPDEAHRKAADALLQQIWSAAPGQAHFDAVDAVARRYKESDLATQNAIAWLCLTYMKDRSRDVPNRWPCCYVIAKSGYEPGVPDLIDILLRDGMEIMRSVAAEALGPLANNPTVHDALVQASRNDTSKQVRDVIAKYIGKDTK